MKNIIVREIFTAKPGQASKLAKMMREAMPKEAIVTTDYVGSYNTVTVDYPVESLAEFEKMMSDYSSKESKEMGEKMKGYTDMYLWGRREIHRIVE